MKNSRILVAILLVGISQVVLAQAQVVGADSILGMIKQGMAPAVGKLTNHAISWLGAFASLQFFITNYNLLKSDGDLSSAVAKAFAAVAWVGVVIYVINNGPEFLQGVGDQMMGLIGDLPSPSSIMSKTVAVGVVMAGAAVGGSAVPAIGNTVGLILTIITLAVLAVGLLFAFKIFMLQLELGLIAMLAPLSFAFLGLSTLKDQGIAPFKALLSLSYRVIILTVILSGFNGVSDIFSNTMNGIDTAYIVTNGFGRVAEIIFSALGAYLLLAYLTWKSDSIAASMANGSTSLGTGDVAQAAAVGAAFGAAMATGGASVTAGASKVPQSMADFVGKMMGGGSVSNASPTGSGGDIPSFTPPSGAGAAPASMSVGAPSPAGGRSTGAASGNEPRQAGTASATPKASVASSRFGPALPDETAASGSAPGAGQSAADLGESGVQAASGDKTYAENDSVDISTGRSEAHNLDAGISSAPQANMSSTISTGRAGMDAAPAATDPMAISPEGSRVRNSGAGIGTEIEAKLPSSTSMGRAAKGIAPAAADPVTNSAVGSQAGSTAAGSSMVLPETNMPSTTSMGRAGKGTAPAAADPVTNSVAGSQPGSTAAGSSMELPETNMPSTTSMGRADKGTAPAAADPVTNSVAGSQPGSTAAGSSMVLPETNMPSTTSMGRADKGTAPAAADPMTISPAGSALGNLGVGSSTAPEANMRSPMSTGNAALDPAPAAPESGSPVAAHGSALSAGIGGKSSLEENLGRLVDHLSSQQQGPRKPTLGERLGEANRHVSQEQATTHVSINPHHHD